MGTENPDTRFSGTSVHGEDAKATKPPPWVVTAAAALLRGPGGATAHRGTCSEAGRTQALRGATAHGGNKAEAGETRSSRDGPVGACHDDNGAKRLVRTMPRGKV